MKRRYLLVGAGSLGVTHAVVAGALAAQERIELSGHQLSALRVAAGWLESNSEFTPEQRKVNHYRLRLHEDKDRFIVHFIPNRTRAEAAEWAGGETARGKECELTLRKRDLVVEQFQFFK